MCDVKSGFCKCPPGTHEDKNLNRCVYNVDAELSEDSQSNKWEDDNGANTTSWNGFSFYPRWFKTTTYLSNNFTNETKNNNLKCKLLFKCIIKIKFNERNLNVCKNFQILVNLLGINLEKTWVP